MSPGLPPDIPLPDEARLASMTIKDYRPSDLTDEKLEALDLYRLIREGDPYLSRGGQEDRVRRITKLSFQDTGQEGNRRFYVAESEGKALGYMRLDEWRLDDSNDQLGNGFLTWMRHPSYNPSFAQYLEESSPRPLLVAVNGVVTATELRGQGVYRKLWQQAMDDLDPGIILGQTQNLVAATARANVTATRGYKTFWGDFEISPGATPDTPPPLLAKDLVDVYAGMHRNGGEVIQISEDLPDVSNFRPTVQRAAQPIIDIQTQAAKEGKRVAVTLPLISVKPNILTMSHPVSNTK